MLDFLGSTDCRERFLFSSKGARESPWGVLMGTVLPSAFRGCKVNKDIGHRALHQATGRRQESAAVVPRTWSEDRTGPQG